MCVARDVKLYSSLTHSSHIRTVGVAQINKKAVLSQGVPRDAAANFGTYRSFQWHRAVFTAVATSNAFELNNSINHGKIRVFNIIYVLPLNSLFNSHCLPPFKMLKLYIVYDAM